MISTYEKLLTQKNTKPTITPLITLSFLDLSVPFLTLCLYKVLTTTTVAIKPIKIATTLANNIIITHPRNSLFAQTTYLPISFLDVDIHFLL